jgi:hypothetical protein
VLYGRDGCGKSAREFWLGDKIQDRVKLDELSDGTW